MEQKKPEFFHSTPPLLMTVVVLFFAAFFGYVLYRGDIPTNPFFFVFPILAILFFLSYQRYLLRPDRLEITYLFGIKPKRVITFTLPPWWAGDRPGLNFLITFPPSTILLSEISDICMKKSPFYTRQAVFSDLVVRLHDGKEYVLGIDKEDRERFLASWRQIP